MLVTLGVQRINEVNHQRITGVSFKRNCGAASVGEYGR